MSSGTETAILIMVLLPCYVVGKVDFSPDGTYWMTHKALTQPPHDIPSQALKINLNNNIISIIPKGSFAKNTACIKLRLDHNRLTEIRADMWTGLKSLKWLLLDNNNITYIEPLGFANLPELEGLYLDHNKLTAITEDIFPPGFDRIQDLSIRENPLHQDSRLCWIQKGQHEGWINGMTAQEQQTITSYCTETLESGNMKNTEVTLHTTTLEDDVHTDLDIDSKDKTAKAITESLTPPTGDNKQHKQLGTTLWNLPVPIVYGMIGFVITIIVIITAVTLFIRGKRASKGPMVPESQCQELEPIEPGPVNTPSVNPNAPLQSSEEDEREEITLPLQPLYRAGDERPVAFLPSSPRGSSASSVQDSQGYLQPVNSGDYSYPYQDKIERFIAFLRIHLLSRQDEIVAHDGSGHSRSQHAHLLPAHPRQSSHLYDEINESEMI